ncbi:phosphotransferase [Lactobacillus sp. DCY120]|uniref:Phosphotransferase n=1 Tax=Bombilactobacillus apium TaxID=2675299 RepID=A0A850R488_9LACO|nr:phosphotransferase [Bombilactobacillus apium]
MQNQDDFCVPEWILSIDGKATMNFRNSKYILLTMLPTEKKTLENWNYNKVLNILSKMHLILSKLSKNNSIINSELTFFNFVNPCSRHLDGYFKNILATSINAVTDNYRFNYLKNYKRQIIHGDFHSSNVFPGKNNKLNIIDFFNSTFDTPLFDLMELMDLFPENKFNILDKYNDWNNCQFTMRDFEYLKFVKAVFYLNRMNENIRFNSRLKGGAMTIKWAITIIDNYLCG